MKLLDFEPVRSSQIKHIAFDEDNQELHIRFRNKKNYKYSPFTKKEYDEFKNSESLGKYFHKNIKKRVVV